MFACGGSGGAVEVTAVLDSPAAQPLCAPREAPVFMGKSRLFISDGIPGVRAAVSVTLETATSG